MVEINEKHVEPPKSIAPTLSPQKMLLSWICRTLHYSEVFRKHNVIVLADEIYARLKYTQDHKTLATVCVPWWPHHNSFN